MLLLLALCLIVCSVRAIPTQNLHKVPMQDGSFSYFSDAELEQIKENATQLYDPQTDVYFHLYTRGNPSASQIIRLDNIEDLIMSNLNPSNPTIVIIHGWGGSHLHGVTQRSKNEYLSRGGFNIIGVDWCEGACTLNYAIARYRVNPTAFVVAQFIEFIVKQASVRFSEVHVIGHSLGGQMAGNVGKHIQTLFPGEMVLYIADK